MKSRSTCKEVFIILAASIVIGFAANAVSSKGISLIRDDSDRFAIDTTGTTVKEKPKLTKEGFVKPQNIPVDAAKKLFDEKVVFIDGREPHEFQEEHIQGAVNIPYKTFLEKTKEEKLEIMKNIGKDQTIVSYCGGGECEISIDNAYEMAKIGYSDVKIYLGGLLEWKASGYPAGK